MVARTIKITWIPLPYKINSIMNDNTRRTDRRSNVCSGGLKTSAWTIFQPESSVSSSSSSSVGSYEYDNEEDSSTLL